MNNITLKFENEISQESLEALFDTLASILPSDLYSENKMINHPSHFGLHKPAPQVRLGIPLRVEDPIPPSPRPPRLGTHPFVDGPCFG